MKSQNTTALVLTIALTLAAGGLVLWQSEHRETPQSLSLETPRDGAAFDVEVAAAEKAVIQNPSQEVVAAAGNPRRRSNSCKHGIDTVLDINGEILEQSCKRSPYESYSSEALDSLAYSDAEAASVLAYRVRHTNYPKALTLALRSAALSGGETKTLTSATKWRPLVDENGEPSLSGYGQAYVLHSVIETLKGRGYQRTSVYEKKLYELSEDPDATFKKLDDIVDRILDDMVQIQLDVTGETNLGGRDDA